MPRTHEHSPDNPAGWATNPGALVYGLDLSRFADSDGDGFGDLRGAMDHLDYVASLGVTWIWLLPFYPSERRDNGYDVDDHLAVDPRFGDLDDVRELLARAHDLGMRVLIDAVPHHTSDRHPWFLAGREDTEGTAGKFFVWSDDDSTEPDDHPMFPGEEESVWTYDERAGRYYHHQFYSFQPDINATDPDVFEEIVQLLTTGSASASTASGSTRPCSSCRARGGRTPTSTMMSSSTGCARGCARSARTWRSSLRPASLRS